MSLDITITDPTTRLRDDMRTVTLLTATFAQRIYAGGLPRDVTLPALAIRRIGGGIDASTGLDDGLYQLDVYGATEALAAAAVGPVLTWLARMEPHTIPQPTPAPVSPVADIRAHSALAMSSLPVPDPNNPATPHVAVTAAITTQTVEVP